MTKPTRAMLAFSTALGLLALTQTAGECGFNPEMKFTTTNAQSGGSPAPLRVGAPKDEDEQEPRETPLSCLQIQTIDETELITEPTPAADCD